jgi:hypothetical protein
MTPTHTITNINNVTHEHELTRDSNSKIPPKIPATIPPKIVAHTGDLWAFNIPNFSYNKPSFAILYSMRGGPTRPVRIEGGHTVVQTNEINKYPYLSP